MKELDLTLFIYLLCIPCNVRYEKTKKSRVVKEREWVAFPLLVRDPRLQEQQ